MGFNTEYLGHLTITPPLNDAEAEWLRGFADWQALPDGDPFALPMNPRAALSKAFADAGGVMSSRRAIPYGVGHWRVCEHGDRIEWHRADKSNDAVQTLSFLVEYYLGPEARARDCGSADFAGFTFDHHLDGVIAAVRQDTEEMFLLRVQRSAITREVIVRGVEWWNDPSAVDGW
ncbi:hypothetical protein [Oryzobacter telluris]|uniref:hypothetical protein n=1 Tax=Oryzobacter telluris TaxID=3149179 RepID=UPI00370D9E61